MIATTAHLAKVSQFEQENLFDKPAICGGKI
jgi:hypothetical protein